MKPNQPRLNWKRRRFMQNATLGATMSLVAPSMLLTPRRAHSASLDDVHTMAAARAKELAGGRDITLKILQPSGSLGNVKPVADPFTAETGIKVEYHEVPLGEITQGRKSVV